MTETWVVGVDGSEQAQVALDWAVEQSRGRDVTLRPVIAWQFPYVGVGPLTGTAVALPADELTAGVTASLEHACERARELAATALDPVVMEGPAAQALLHATEGSSMLILGNRGRGGFTRLLLGSVGHQCATHADVPTVVVPAGTEATPIDRVIVAVDNSPNSLAALRWACEFASTATTIEVIQMWSPPELGIDGLDHRVLADMAESAERRFRDRVAETLEAFPPQPGSPRFTVRFVHDDARRRLAEESGGADLLVVGARGRRGLTGAVLGSVSTWLLHHSLCPVAIVPTSPEESS
jgi:nucleotide-binding universal stress UspA family protein